MGRLEAHPGRQSDRQTSQLQCEQADDAGKKRNRKQKESVLQEEDDPGDDQRQQRQRVAEVVSELLRLDQEQLRDAMQRSPELSHVEHCSRASSELPSTLDAPSKVPPGPRRVSAILTPFFRAPT